MRNHTIDRRRLLNGATLAGVGAAAAAIASGSTSAQESDPGVVPLKLPSQAPQKEGFVDVGDGHALWYFDTGGNGVPVIFLHPGTGSGVIWGYQQPVFVQAGFRVIGYSRRGYPKSKLGDPEKPGIGSEDLTKLADHLGLTRFHLVGSAAGGMVAADFAISHEDRLHTLVLANTVMGIVDEDFQAISPRMWPEEFQRLPSEIKELGPSYRHLDVEGTKLWVEHEQARKGVSMKSAGYANKVNWAGIGAWRLPVLVMTGDADLYMPPSVMRLFHRKIRGAEMHIIADSGHSAYWERPLAFNKVVLDFLQRHPPA